MNKKILISIFMAITSSSSFAETATIDLIACVSKKSLDEAFTYMVKGDNDGLRQLGEARECLIIPKSTNISVIDYGVMKSKIRFAGMVLYAPSEFIK